MHLCSRRVSGAADREQPCGLVDGRMAAAAFRILGFWQEADEPPTRGSVGAGGRVGRVELRRTLGPQTECYWGLLA